MDQHTLKQRAAIAGADYVLTHVPKGAVLGVGTGSTVNVLIDTLVAQKAFERYFRGAVSSSRATTALLESHRIPVFDLNQVDALPLYIDGADEIDPHGQMIKGGGGALTGEKIVAMAAEAFVCIADVSKYVPLLCRFALPVEVIPMACAALSRRFAARGGAPTLRRMPDGAPYLTDYGHQVMDVAGLKMDVPQALERELSAWPGVVTVGLFAQRRADVCLLGTPEGVRTITCTKPHA